MDNSNWNSNDHDSGVFVLLSGGLHSMLHRSWILAIDVRTWFLHTQQNFVGDLDGSMLFDE